MKKVMRAFEDDGAVIMATEVQIEEQDQHLFCEGVKAIGLQQRWEKFVDLRRKCELNNLDGS